MAENSITDEQRKLIYTAIEAKSHEPDMTFEDCFKGVNEIHPSHKKDIKIWSCICAITALISLGMLIFCENGSNVYVCGLICYIISFSVECLVLLYYGQKGYSGLIVLLGVFLGYVAIKRDINEDMLLEIFNNVKSFL